MPTALQMQAMELEVESFRNAPLSDTRLTHYVTWQYYHHSQWTDLDQCVSARLELIFCSSCEKYAKVLFINAEDIEEYSVVNLETMRILSVGSEIFVRRSDNNSLNTSEFEFMNDDNSYLPVDPYMSSTLNVMLSAFSDAVGAQPNWTVSSA